MIYFVILHSSLHIALKFRQIYFLRCNFIINKKALCVRNDCSSDQNCCKATRTTKRYQQDRSNWLHGGMFSMRQPFIESNTLKACLLQKWKIPSSCSHKFPSSCEGDYAFIDSVAMPLDNEYSHHSGILKNISNASKCTLSCLGCEIGSSILSKLNANAVNMPHHIETHCGSPLGV